ncbi:Zinc finger, CCHC-type [Fagus crenata]
MSVLWDQLALMEPKWTVDAELYYQYREETRLVQFLMALQDDFESIRSSILHRIPRPSVDATLSELLAEETRKGILIHKGIEAESVFIATQHTKYSTQSLNSFGNNQGKYRDISIVECRYCHKFGHMKSNCLELKGRYDPRKSNRTAALASSESENLATTSQSSQLSSDHPTADQVQEMIKQDRLTGKLVGTGRKVGRLFILETLEVSKSINARLAASVLESSSFSLWLLLF